MALPPTPPKNLSIGITITADGLKPSTRTYHDPLDATIESKIARRVVNISEDGHTTEAHRTTTTITIVEEHYTARPTEMTDYYYATTQEDLP